MTTPWQDIHAEALRRIQSREWAPGHLIPPESKLAQEFGCSRATVNRALQALADTGLLERRRRAGTRVASAPQRRAQLAIPLIRQEIEARGQTATHSILARETRMMPPRLAAALDLPGSIRALHLKTLYLADGQAFAFEDRWINPDAAPGIADAPLTRISANEWLVQNVSFSHGTLDYSAVAAGAEAAAHLGCAAGDSVMVLERRTFGPEIPVTFMRLTYAPGHRLHISL